MSTLALYGGKPVRTEGPASQWPVVDEREKEALARVIDSGKLLYGQGEEGVRFEEELAEWMGAKYALGTVNGTETMVLALKAAGVCIPQTAASDLASFGSPSIDGHDVACHPGERINDQPDSAGDELS